MIGVLIWLFLLLALTALAVLVSCKTIEPTTGHVNSYIEDCASEDMTFSERELCQLGR